MADELEQGLPLTGGAVLTANELEEQGGENPPVSNDGPENQTAAVNDEQGSSEEDLTKDPDLESQGKKPDNSPDDKAKKKRGPKPKQGPDLPKETKPAKNKPVEKIKPNAVYECNFAPMGECNVTIIYKQDGREFIKELSLVDKRYKIPEELPEEEKVFFRKALIANNFTDVTVLDAGTSYDKDQAKLIYKVVHPDQAERNNINGSISLVLLDDNGAPMYHKNGESKGKQIQKQVVITNGKVFTDDKLVYEALLRAGFKHSGTVPKEE